MAKDPNAIKTVNFLVQAANADTVYRDVYLRRARHLFTALLDESAYRAIGSTAREIDQLTRRSRAAVVRRDWKEAAELSAQADALRQRNAALSHLAALGKDVYEAEPVVFDPFSPGKHLGTQADANQRATRGQILDTLASLAKSDSAQSGFYDARRSYFTGLEVATPGAAQRSAQQSRVELEQLAFEAAERGDTAALQKLAKELQELQGTGATAGAALDASVVMTRYRCPADLTAPFAPAVIERARDLGLAEVRIAPLPEYARVLEVIYAHAGQPVPSNPDMEHEGVLRARAQAELEIPKELDTEAARVLAGQFIQQIFLNSGGARYLPPLAQESVLVEDVAESEAADGPSKLLAALELAKRSGLARVEIESALMRKGPEILENDLGLDPTKFRLVCVPYDLYTRYGRQQGFGKWPRWTHFDGYQVMTGNRLRALIGGDGRFGGLYDLVSISPSDARAGVYARFAIVRRARMTLRWR